MAPIAPKTSRPWIARLCAFAVGICMVGGSLPAGAAPPSTRAGNGDKVDPDSANEKRFAAQEQARKMTPGEAATLLMAEARQHKDPVLFLDAAQAYERAADEERDPGAAMACQIQAAVALDMLYFLDTEADSPDWQPLESADLPGAIERGETASTTCKALQDEIETEIAAAEAAAMEAGTEEPEKKRSKIGPKGLLIGGGVALAVGVGGIAMGSAGLGIGSGAQSDVTDDRIVDPGEHSAAEQRGRTGNALAYAGFIVGGVGVAAGVALIILGLRKRKSQGEMSRIPVLVPTGRGLAVTGRF